MVDWAAWRARLGGHWLAVPLLLWWLIAAPFFFMMLYTTLDLQRASRAALPTQADLANYRVVGLANDIEVLQANIGRDQTAMTAAAVALGKQKDVFDSDRSVARQVLLDYAASHQLTVDLAKCPADWPALSQCYDDVRAEAGAKSLMSSADFTAAGAAMIKTKVEVIDYNQTVRANNDANARLTSDKALYDQLLSGKDVDGTVGGGAVAFTFDRLRSYFPLIPYIFVLPSGVIVAFFAGLMGSIGGAIGSLSNQLNADKPTVTLAQAYVIRPVLGALAGFIVFFVVAAGAAFLVQPTAASATTAVNSLSPPALASLGVFAGLSSELAIKWLTGKANQFFTN